MNAPEKPTCFVVMPFSDAGGAYDPGHWSLVYQELLKPACEVAGFIPNRADERSDTSIIITDVLKSLHKADMVLCDISGQRANVFFELGLRQAFDLPVVIVKDELTKRPFDIATLRDVEYQSSLRSDLVRKDIDGIARSLRETYDNRDKADFSLVRLLEIGVAKPAPPAGEDAQVTALTSAVNRMASEVEGLRQQVEGRKVGARDLGGNSGTINLALDDFVRKVIDAQPNTSRSTAARHFVSGRHAPSEKPKPKSD